MTTVSVERGTTPKSQLEAVSQEVELAPFQVTVVPSKAQLVLLPESVEVAPAINFNPAEALESLTSR